MTTGLSPKFPLVISEYGDFALNETSKELVKQNFKNLLLTIPGERIMLPDFGIGVQKYLFEQARFGAIENISSDITSQLERYLPYIQLLNVNLDYQNSTDDIISIQIKYYIKPLTIEDTIEVSGI